MVDDTVSDGGVVVKQSLHVNVNCRRVMGSERMDRADALFGGAGGIMSIIIERVE